MTGYVSAGEGSGSQGQGGLYDRVTAQRAWGPQGWRKAPAKQACWGSLLGSSSTQPTPLSPAGCDLLSHLSGSWVQIRPCRDE